MTRLRTLLSTPRRRVVAGLLALAVVAAGVGVAVLPGGDQDAPAVAAPASSTSATATTTRGAAPTTTAELGGPVFPTTVAAASVDAVEVFAGPTEVGGASRTLQAADELSGQLVFVVEEERGEWLNVELPARPNGATGWIRSTDVDLSTHDFSIEVRLGDHRMIVRNGDAVELDTEIGVGTTDAPTPGGTYYVKELLQPPDPDGGYGPYAYGLSGFSTVFTSYSGGAGVIGIHGTNRPETVGTDVSDGCIRISNDVITQMVDEIGLPLGTPVTIVA